MILVSSREIDGSVSGYLDFSYKLFASGYLKKLAVKPVRRLFNL